MATSSTNNETILQSTQSTLKAAFNAEDPKLDISFDPRLKIPIVTFDPILQIKRIEPTSIYDTYENTLPFPNRTHPGRKPILKNKMMSNCSSFYECLNSDNSGIAEALTKTNTVVNAGGPLNVIRAKNAKQDRLNRKHLRRLSKTSIKSGKSASKRSSISITDYLNSGFDQNIPDNEPLSEIPNSFDQGPIGHHRLNSQNTIVFGKRRMSVEDFATAVVEAQKDPILTVAMVQQAGKGVTRLSNKEDPEEKYRILRNEKPVELPIMPEIEPQKPFISLLREYRDHRVDFEKINTGKLYKYGMALAHQELQYRIPIKLHARNIREIESKADQEYSRIMELIDPPNRPLHTRKANDSSTDPFGIIRQSKIPPLQHITAPPIPSPSPPPPEKHRKHEEPPKNSLLSQYTPDAETVNTVNSWLEKIPQKESTTVWIQPILAKLDKKAAEKVIVKRSFNIVDGRVRFPFYDPTAINTFSKKYMHSNTRDILHKKLGPYDTFQTLVQMDGFQNNEISFEYMKNKIFVTGKTLCRFAKKSNIRRVDESVQLPERLAITDLEYSRDRYGNVIIEELPDDEKQQTAEANRLYATSSQSIHKIFK